LPNQQGSEKNEREDGCDKASFHNVPQISLGRDEIVETWNRSASVRSFHVDTLSPLRQEIVSSQLLAIVCLNLKYGIRP